MVPAKNYLAEAHIQELNRIVSAYLDLAENRAQRGVLMKMPDWATPPYRFEFERKITDRPVLVARYCRNLDGFARFLREHGELSNADA